MKRRWRAFIFQGREPAEELKLDDGTVFTIKDGNRRVIIKDQAKAEAYLDEMDCWKPDQAKLLKIFGKMLKVPTFFKVERAEETLAIKPPRTGAS
jgi:hypothetical protein